MTPVEQHLERLIRINGPLTVAQYTTEVLYHPRFGYYTGRNPIGRLGDFVTSPEISQIFGELIGLWMADRWHALGRPAPVTIVEMGPGQGTLMKDLVRALKVVPNFLRSSSIHLIEISPELEKQQRSVLEGIPVDVFWHKDIATVPHQPCFLIANEFFDALPIHQFVRTKDGWRERLIAWDAGSLVPVLSSGPTPTMGLLDQAPQRWDHAEIAEVSPASLAIAAKIGQRLAEQGGAGLIVDYGDQLTEQNGELRGLTWQAVKNHQKHDPLETPGTADLTAHVDFKQVSEVIEQAGAKVFGPVEQGSFLVELGLDTRTETLCDRAPEAVQGVIRSGAARLADKQQMGALFKVLAVCEPNATLPPGFSTFVA